MVGRRLRGFIYRRNPGGIFVPAQPWFSRMPSLGRLDVGDTAKIVYGQEWLQAKTKTLGILKVYGAAEGSTSNAYTKEVSVPTVRQDVIDTGNEWATENL